MSRFLMGLLLSVAVLLTAMPAQATVYPSTGAESTITLTGTLTRVETGVPHYALNGYVVLYDNTDVLGELAGQIVTVEGRLWTGPSIYMTKAVMAKQISPLIGTPGHRDQENVILPIPNQIPLFPVYGTSYNLLVGRLEAVRGQFFLAVEGPESESRVPVRSDFVNLGALVGKRVAAIIAQGTAADGSTFYSIRDAIVLTGDLSIPIKEGRGLIYTAPADAITILLRGRRVQMDAQPIVGNGRTLIGLRAVAEGLGADVWWDQSRQTAGVYLNGRTVEVKVGSQRAVVLHGGTVEEVILADVAPVIVDGRTMVPLRLISTALGLNVSWDAPTRTIHLD